ncbi:hypothetical protein N7471_006847 [Penicillium samsonianum]|uniref:uncharacterized protein n=1 Tax=Penicillium samsonianum TaxID=1882272 RepID=UPI002547A44A|nr:uncharacterized protein N7471_006847 [Penicillium samsonianum]KAJ6140361.1 hypothetical protein N7471_006847 [Penicillium samsonianum]
MACFAAILYPHWLVTGRDGHPAVHPQNLTWAVSDVGASYLLQQEKKGIWSADLYGKKVAPFVATSTEKVLAWLDPKSTGKS